MEHTPHYDSYVQILREELAAIAEKYGCGESRVKTSLHRTREKLRDYLQKEDIWL